MVNKQGQQWVPAEDGGWWIQPGWVRHSDAEEAMAELLAPPAAERDAIGVKVLPLRQAGTRTRYTVHATRVRWYGKWYGKGACQGNPFMDAVVERLAPIVREA